MSAAPLRVDLEAEWRPAGLILARRRRRQAIGWAGLVLLNLVIVGTGEGPFVNAILAGISAGYLVRTVRLAAGLRWVLAGWPEGQSITVTREASHD